MHSVSRAWPLVIITVALAACGSDSTTSPAGSDGTATTVTTVSAAVTETHPGHAGLAAALPAASELTFLPADTIGQNDSDLTSTLQIASCDGAPTKVASRTDDATNRSYLSGQYPVADITFHDLETTDGAVGFTSALETLLACMHPANGLTFEQIPPTPNECDHVILMRTNQPVGTTIDGWCQVGNLAALFRLYPTHPNGETTPDDPGVQPTDEQALTTLTVVGTHLRAVFEGS